MYRKAVACGSSEIQNVISTVQTGGVHTKPLQIGTALCRAQCHWGHKQLMPGAITNSKIEYPGASAALVCAQFKNPGNPSWNLRLPRQ